MRGVNLDDLRGKARQALRDLKHEAITKIQVTPSFRGYLIDHSSKLFELPKEFQRLMDSGLAKEVMFDYFRQAGKAGGVIAWVFCADGMCLLEGGTRQTGVTEKALIVTGQTEADVLIMHQFYVLEPQLTWIGPPLEQVYRQDQFGGRQKMFGATRADITGRDPARANAKRVGIEIILEGE